MRVIAEHGAHPFGAHIVWHPRPGGFAKKYQRKAAICGRPFDMADLFHICQARRSALDRKIIGDNADHAAIDKPETGDLAVARRRFPIRIREGGNAEQTGFRKTVRIEKGVNASAGIHQPGGVPAGDLLFTPHLARLNFALPQQINTFFQRFSFLFHTHSVSPFCRFL